MQNLKSIFESIAGGQTVAGIVYYCFEDRNVILASRGRHWSILYMENFLYRRDDDEPAAFDEKDTRIFSGILYIRKNISLENGIIHNDQTEFCVYEDQGHLWKAWPGRHDPILLEDWVQYPDPINRMFIEDARKMLKLNKQF